MYNVYFKIHILIDATLSYFGEGSGPLYNIECPSTGKDDQECLLIITTASSSCAHVGVKCLLFTDVGAVSSQPSEGANGTIGALIGLLAAALVVVVAGWIVSCVYFQWKINK